MENYVRIKQTTRYGLFIYLGRQISCYAKDGALCEQHAPSVMIGSDTLQGHALDLALALYMFRADRLGSKCLPTQPTKQVSNHT
jgi:hypothetical protein